ncbi:GDYXXLXY domain-containing protein [Hyphomicrobium sp.]|uniref:GDYXXLXY domain-containing protein n=1 Tax=Hyphomicrobium sp. TaxID=82 RepID=UPI002E32E6FB|nr:GDYXXLXY domain-containing protein [Hyphomicrobium sp.]HEX2839904.1 GDYXXLXY domain-containing protein [Hyphomicrobium sp.]
MINLSPRSWLAIAAVALIQTAALATMVYGRASLLLNGREIVAEVIPVDPRDLFRGDYVILGYTFGTGEIRVPKATVQGDKVYVTLKPGTAAGQWEVVSASDKLTEPSDPAQVVLKGIVSYVSAPPAEGELPKASVHYGIESYFVPEGTGRELEQKVRDKKISALLAVGKSGEVAIKGLMVDGERLAQEPLL